MLTIGVLIVVGQMVHLVSSTVNQLDFQKVSEEDLIYSDHLLFDSTARSKLSCFNLCASSGCCMGFTYTGDRRTPGRCRGHSTRLFAPEQGTGAPGTSTYVWTGSTQTSNLALNQVSSQSSDHYSDSGHAYLANDGNLEANILEDEVTHSDLSPDPSWWQVDLDGSHLSYFVVSVIVTNREDCCGNRLRDFDVEVYSEDPTTNPSAAGALCFHYDGPMATAATEELTCLNGPIIGRFVRVTNSPGEYLSLGEVQVMAFTIAQNEE